MEPATRIRLSQRGSLCEVWCDQDRNSCVDTIPVTWIPNNFSYHWNYFCTRIMYDYKSSQVVSNVSDWMTWARSSTEAGIFYFAITTKWLWSSFSLLSNRYENLVLSQRETGRSVKLITYVHLQPKLMRSISPCVFMAVQETTSLSPIMLR